MPKRLRHQAKPLDCWGSSTLSEVSCDLMAAKKSDGADTLTKEDLPSHLGDLLNKLANMITMQMQALKFSLTSKLADLSKEIPALEAEEGKDIVCFCATLLQSMLQEEKVDSTAIIQAHRDDTLLPEEDS
ncbi:hypothetical protein NDU88_006292 [Pleurodeles waltl]|uniref:Uncharacterized protein n=1 Tax=Pleurodeles waltl TaxID=8319 RepID=A0AAV7RNJ4_PLEWA|nr:hypothetical protein NDU88_006292 [Pleurodeles waltl]